VAARNCRKRKIDQIKQLEDDVTRIRCRKAELVSEHEKLQDQRRHWNDVVKGMHDHILKVKKSERVCQVAFSPFRNSATIPICGNCRWITIVKCTFCREEVDRLEEYQEWISLDNPSQK